MKPMLIPLFDGLVTVKIQPQTLETDHETRRIQAGIKGDLNPDDPLELNDIDEFGYLYACLVDLEFHFDGRERGPLQALKAWWDGRKKQKLGQIWRDYRANITRRVHDNLWLALREVQQPYDPNPVTLPEAMLTEEQKAELAQPDSPLAVNG